MNFSSTITTTAVETNTTNNTSNNQIVGSQANNPAPVAVNDTETTPIHSPVLITVLTNDMDPSTGQTLTISSNTNPSNGTVTLSG